MPHSPLFRQCLHLLRRSANYSTSTTAVSATPFSHLTRRRFIRSTALVGGTASVLPAINPGAAAWASSGDRHRWGRNRRTQRRLPTQAGGPIGHGVRSQTPGGGPHPVGDGASGARAGAETVDADYVILALPFTVLRQVDLHVELPAGLTRFIHEVDLGANEKLFAGFNQKVWRQSGGFINEIWTDQGYSQAWESTQRQPDSQAGALTFYLGGEDAIASQTTTAAAQGEAFVQGLGGAIADLPAAANGHFFRTAWSQDPFAQGAYTSFKPGQLTEFAEFFYIEADIPGDRQDVSVGNLIFAGEHLSDEFYGYMNGAAQTGRLAADIVAERVLKPNAYLH